MSKRKFKHHNFTSGTLRTIAKCNEIIETYQDKGYTLTLRQLYYQLVARDLIPNKVTEYDKLGEAVSKGRLQGLIDWDAIEDRTRALRGIGHTDSPEEAIKDAAGTYFRDKWETQPYRVEVWIEKEALAGIFSRICNKLDIDYFSCRGYASQTAMYDAGMRFAYYRRKGQETKILHFGDHDPSGIDMTRDVRERLEMFLEGEGISVDRLALNMDQVRKYDPPPNPAKETDSRHNQYVSLYGHSSWELDALEPDVLAALVEEEVKSFRDEGKWAEAVATEKREKETLKTISNRYDDVQEFLTKDTEEDY